YLVDTAATTGARSAREHANEEAKREAARQMWAARRRLREAIFKPQLLLSRVQDDEVREETTSLVTAANRARNFDMDEVTDAFEEVQTGYSRVVDRIGELLRERY